MGDNYIDVSKHVVCLRIIFVFQGIWCGASVLRIFAAILTTDSMVRLEANREVLRIAQCLIRSPPIFKPASHVQSNPTIWRDTIRLRDGAIKCLSTLQMT